MARKRNAVLLAGLAGATLGFFSCAPTLEKISEVRKVRLLGVKKSAPYARPGEAVTLRMLWEDGAEDPPRSMQTFWATWCVNPPGDLFSECLSEIGTDPQLSVGTSETTITVPEDVLRPSVADPNYPPYGLIYVFYGVCAGNLEWLGEELGPGGAGGGGNVPSDQLPDFGDEAAGSALVPSCVDDAGKALGSDDFIVGYSAVFAYENYRNPAPKIDGFRVAGEEVAVDCLDDDCDGPFPVPALTDCAPGVACFEACPEDGAESCPEIELGPVIDPDSVDQDEIALDSYGNDLKESMWVSYFVDRGALSSELRLVNDPETGFNPEYQTQFRAPQKPGPLRLWAVVRDSRGGVAWVRVPAYVRASQND